MAGGRPKKEINYKLVESLASIFCTQEEIASVLNISTRTLQRDEEFNRVFKRGQEMAKSSLRRIQWKHAEKSAAMAIWLGKQYLGQRDNIEVSNTEEINKVKDLLTKIEQGANNG
jgi:hypothetical protein